MRHGSGQPILSTGRSWKLTAGLTLVIAGVLAFRSGQAHRPDTFRPDADIPQLEALGLSAVRDNCAHRSRPTAASAWSPSTSVILAMSSACAG